MIAIIADMFRHLAETAHITRRSNPGLVRKWQEQSVNRKPIAPSKATMPDAIFSDCGEPGLNVHPVPVFLPALQSLVCVA